jgi:hypothetical protein
MWPAAAVAYRVLGLGSGQTHAESEIDVVGARAFFHEEVHAHDLGDDDVDESRALDELGQQVSFPPRNCASPQAPPNSLRSRV